MGIFGPKHIDNCSEKPESGSYYLRISELPSGPMCDFPGIMVDNDKCFFYTCQEEVAVIHGTPVKMAYIDCAEANGRPDYAKYVNRLCK